MAYSHCAYFVIPSLQERFPITSAGGDTMQGQGEPLDYHLLPEVTGEAALLLSPAVPEAYVGALQRLAADAALRQELSLKKPAPG